MGFVSIGQYFNKLQIAFLATMMPPLMAFIATYLWPDQESLVQGIVYNIAIALLALLSWLFATATFNKRIKSVRNQQGLGTKLEKYFSITTVRYRLVSCAGLVLAAGRFLTGEEFFTGLYLASLTFSFFLWPTGRRTSRELRLRGDEREMVYFRRDQI